MGEHAGLDFENVAAIGHGEHAAAAMFVMAMKGCCATELCFAFSSCFQAEFTKERRSSAFLEADLERPCCSLFRASVKGFRGIATPGGVLRVSSLERMESVVLQTSADHCSVFSYHGCKGCVDSIVLSRWCWCAYLIALVVRLCPYAFTEFYGPPHQVRTNHLLSSG